MLTAKLHELEACFFKGSITVYIELGRLLMLSFLEELIGPETSQIKSLLSALVVLVGFLDLSFGQKLAPCVNRLILKS